MAGFMSGATRLGGGRTQVVLGVVAAAAIALTGIVATNANAAGTPDPLLSGPSDSRVGDLVWLDTNENGTKQLTEKGMSGIEVQLWAVPEQRLVTKTRTNTNGNYQFTNLQTERCYRIDVVIPAGYRATLLDASSDELVDSDINNGGVMAKWACPGWGKNTRLWFDAGLRTGGPATTTTTTTPKPGPTTSTTARSTTTTARPGTTTTARPGTTTTARPGTTTTTARATTTTARATTTTARPATTTTARATTTTARPTTTTAPPIRWTNGAIGFQADRVFFEVDGIPGFTAGDYVPAWVKMQAYVTDSTGTRIAMTTAPKVVQVRDDGMLETEFRNASIPNSTSATTSFRIAVLDAEFRGCTARGIGGPAIAPKWSAGSNDDFAWPVSAGPRKTAHNSLILYQQARSTVNAAGTFVKTNPVCS